jgi:predicted secreted protein with PEFG-CTERM motif
MKSKPIGALLVVLAMVVGIITFAPAAFAQQTVQVTMSKGDAADQSCVAAGNCYSPSSVNVSPGDTVTWTNADTASHTVTSGKPSDNQTGTVFDSSLIKAGATFSHTFASAGMFNYYCQVHPWMAGMVTVGAAATQETYQTRISSDGSTYVTISTTPAVPTSGKPITIELNFTSASGGPIKHQNYAITAMQDNNTVLTNPSGHTHTGLDQQTTSNLASSDPITIQVTLNGAGLPGTDSSTWTGPKGDVVNFQVVPEFGPVAMLVLVIAVISIIAFTAKTRGIPRL